MSLHRSDKYSAILLIGMLSALFSCRKDNYNPVQKNSVGIYYWFTNYNSVSQNWWMRKKDNQVWTWYNSTYKAFDSDNKLIKSLNIPLEDVYLNGDYTNGHFQGSFILNNENNLENAYLQYNAEDPDPAFNSVYLNTTEINDLGHIVRQKSKFVHFHYADELRAMRFTKTASNYYFVYILTALDSVLVDGLQTRFRDSLVTIKTDLDLNILSRKEIAVSDTLENKYHYLNDVQAGNSRVYVTRTEWYYFNALEIYDADMDMLNFVKAEDIYPGAATWYQPYNAFQKIFVKSDRIIVFGDKQESYDANQTLLMTVFDIDGTFLSSYEIPTRKPSAVLKGVEPCADGKFLLYYSESEEASGSTYAGVCKVSAEGVQDYAIVFPENDPNNYSPCMAYENADGTINIFAVRESQQSAAQTIVVKMDQTGQIR